LKIALIGGERLYESLRYEGEVIPITPDNWPHVFRYSKPDLFIVESCFETASGHWFMAQTEAAIETSSLALLIETAQRAGIPTIYWFTLDHQFHRLFLPFAKLFSQVFCADVNELRLMRESGINADLLLPAVQPALFNPIHKYGVEPLSEFNIVCDGIADIISNQEAFQHLGPQLASMGLKVYQTDYSVWETKVNNFPEMKDAFIGSVDFESRRAILKDAQIYLCLSPRDTNPTEQQWQTLEAAASRMAIVHNGVLEEGDIRRSFASSVEDPERFLLEILRLKKDSLYRERRAHIAWRSAVMHHSFSNRLKAICEKIGVRNDWVEWPRATLIAPTFRPHFIDRILNQYDAQTYPNKELVIVFNGLDIDLPELPDSHRYRSDIRLLHAPKELAAGACMNLGIQAASGQYVFRFDDDDYYGENYLLDTMLHTRSCDFDVSGKVFRYFVIPSRYRNKVFRRNQGFLGFRRPALLQDTPPPNFTIMSGATQGGQKAVFVNYPFPNNNFGAADSALLDKHAVEFPGRAALILDDLNFVVERRSNAEHTWKTKDSVLLRFTDSAIGSSDEITRV